MQLNLPQEVGAGVAVVSLLMFVASLIGVPIFLTRISDDHFAKPRSHSVLRRILSIVIGGTFVVMGIAMIFLPGQGVLTIVVGLGMMDLPIRDRIITRLLSLQKVKRTIDKLRRKAGKGPLLVPTGR